MLTFVIYFYRFAVGVVRVFVSIICHGNLAPVDISFECVTQKFQHWPLVAQ